MYEGMNKRRHFNTKTGGYRIRNQPYMLLLLHLVSAPIMHQHGVTKTLFFWSRNLIKHVIRSPQGIDKLENYWLMLMLVDVVLKSLGFV